MNRIPVRHCGVIIGTLPADFNPRAIVSADSRYRPCPSDFLREGDVWSAAPLLTLDDFAAIADFAPPESKQNP